MATGGVAMSLVRKFAVLVLTVLLISTLVTGNLLAAAHLTVLDPGFVQNTVEEEGGYDLVEDAAVETASTQVQNMDSGGSADISALVDTEGLIRDSIDQSYLQNQTEGNVDRLYAYLHGNSETLNLTIDAAPLKDDVEAAVESQIRNASIAELLTQSETDLASIGGDELPVQFNQTTVELMTANESGYQAVREDIRVQLREQVLDSLVQQAWEQSSNDEKLALVIPDYDPRDYSEAQKAQMVDDRESEIRAGLRDRIEQERGEEIEQGIDDQLTQANETLAPEPSGDESGIEAATIEMRAAFVAGLTTEMTYEEFRSDLDGAKADAAVAVGEEVSAQLDQQLEDRISLTADMNAESQQALQQGQTAVTWLDRLAIILPLLALVLVGLVYFVTRSGQTVASSLGVSLLAAGLPIYLSLGILQSTVEQRVEAQLAAGDPSELIQAGADLALGIFGQLFGRIGTVSLAFTVGGTVLLAVWLALRYDVIDGSERDERTAAEAAAAADAEAMDDDNGDDDEGDDDADDDAATAVAGDTDADGPDGDADESVSEDGPVVEETGDDGDDPLSDVVDEE